MANTRGIEQTRTDVSVLFSEPKIPQSAITAPEPLRCQVSVLFSEPKIPQYPDGFSGTAYYVYVSVLFSEPKIPQSAD